MVGSQDASFRFSIMWGGSTPLRREVIQMRAGMRVGEVREVVGGMGGSTCSIFPKLQHRGYYLPTRGYQFYLRVFNYLRVFDKSEHSERVRYRVEREKIKFISTRGHVIFCLLYKHQ